MDIFDLLDQFEHMLEHAPRIPLTGRLVIGEDELIEFVEHLRQSLPDDIQQARWLTKERQRYLKEAEEEAKKIIELASSRANTLVDENKIKQDAKQKAQELLTEAQKAAGDVRAGANEYAEGVLGRLEEYLAAALTSIQQGREMLKAKKS
ncbi:MAG TPA: ATPase [bacterium]|jgi:vacuolar-type H+-ATPase subunit H|nr:ATPase [bacterium]